MYIGAEYSKTFFAKQGDEVIPATGITASLYDPKSQREYQRFDNGGTNPALEDLGEGYFKVTATPEISRKFPHGVEIWLAISIGSHKKIFAGVFGTFYTNPLSDVL